MLRYWTENSDSCGTGRSLLCHFIQIERRVKKQCSLYVQPSNARIDLLLSMDNAHREKHGSEYYRWEIGVYHCPSKRLQSTVNTLWHTCLHKYCLLKGNLVFLMVGTTGREERNAQSSVVKDFRHSTARCLPLFYAPFRKTNIQGKNKFNFIVHKYQLLKNKRDSGFTRIYQSL